MRKVILISFLFLAATFVNAQETKKIEIYYFHLKNRCVTCRAVEKVTTETLKDHFSTQMKAGTITYKSINFEDKKNKALAKKYKIKGQSLVVIQGDKKIDLTAKGFQYARNKPKDFERILKKEINSLL